MTITKPAVGTRFTSFATGTPTGGSMAWFGWDAAVARGDVQIVEA